MNAILNFVKEITDPNDANRKLCEPFMTLPSKKLYPDYFQIIKKPLCLNKIEKNLEKYVDLEDFALEIKILFKNATVYNADGSLLFNDANYIIKQLKNHAEFNSLFINDI